MFLLLIGTFCHHFLCFSAITAKIKSQSTEKHPPKFGRFCNIYIEIQFQWMLSHQLSYEPQNEPNFEMLRPFYLFSESRDLKPARYMLVDHIHVT